MIARSLQDVKPQPTSSGMCVRCVGFRDVLGQHRPQMVILRGSVPCLGGVLYTRVARVEVVGSEDSDIGTSLPQSRAKGAYDSGTEERFLCSVVPHRVSFNTCIPQ